MAQLAMFQEVISQASLEMGIVQRPVNTVIGTADQDIAQLAALIPSEAERGEFSQRARQLLDRGKP